MKAAGGIRMICGEFLFLPVKRIEPVIFRTYPNDPITVLYHVQDIIAADGVFSFYVFKPGEYTRFFIE